MTDTAPGSAQYERIVAEFTHQAAAFSAAPVMRAAETLDGLVAALPLRAGSRWIDVACGTGIVTCAIAPHVGEAVGVDLTPAMLDQAAAEARRAGTPNASFAVGDALALPFADGAFDGAVTRFSMHHIPHPARVVREMARVVRPGGTVAVADHLTCADPDGQAWHYEVERLRDPSHWCSLTADRFFALGARAGLRVRDRRTVPYTMAFDEWLQRGSGAKQHSAVIAELLRDAPPAVSNFFGVEGGVLRMTLAIGVWQVPDKGVTER